MKRRPFQSMSTILLSAGTLISSLCTAPLTYARDITASAVDENLLPAGVEIDGKHYWTVSEMMEASELVDAKRKEFCADHGSIMCESELSMDQAIQFGGIYSALDTFDSIRFMLTSINPSRGTMKLLFRDEDKMMSQITGSPVRYSIDSLFSVWVEESLGDPAVDTRWLANGYHYPYNLGANEEETKAASHTIIDESSSVLGAGWFTPNVEREYDARGSQIENNTGGRIFFTYSTTPFGGGSQGLLSYESCINSPDYREGMECKLMYYADGFPKLLPMESVEDTQNEVTDDILEDSTQNHSTDDSLDAKPSSADDSSVTLAVASETASTQSKSTTPKAPNTSTADNPEQNKVQIAKFSDDLAGSSLASDASREEFSFALLWQLVTLVLFGSFVLVFLVWFFLPLFKQRSIKKS